MGESLTPCHGRGDWFAVDNRGGTDRSRKTKAEMEQDVSDILRAKLTCLTRCKVRKQCMETALSFEDNNHWVWGGYGGGERARILEDGPLPVPSDGAAVRFDRVNQFIDFHLLRSEAAELWGMTERGVETALNRYIWDLRVIQGDQWVMLPAKETKEQLAQSGGIAAPVRAA